MTTAPEAAARRAPVRLRRTATIGGLTLLVLLVLAGGARPAFAHAELVTSEPAADAALPTGEPPTSVTLRFTEGVQIPSDAIRVVDVASGEDVAGVSDAGAGESAAVVVATVPSLDDGSYVVDWRVVSADSHPISGAFTFTVGEPSADADAIAGLLEGDRNRGIAIAFGVTRALAFASVLVLVGGILFVRLCWPAAGERDAVRALLWVCWLVALVTAVVGIGMQAAYSSGRDLGAAWDTDVLSDVLGTDFGRAWLARVPLVIIAIGALRDPGRPRTPLVNGVDAVLGFALLASFTFAGHARTGRFVALATATDLLHLAAAAAWFGGLALLCVLLADRARPRGARSATVRFSNVAGPAIGLLAVTGSVQAWRQSAGLESLFETTYGRLVLVKAGLVVFVVAAASVSRHVVQQWRARGLAPVGPGAAVAEADADEWRDLRSAVVVEVAIAAVVLAVTAALVNTQPARVAAGAAPAEQGQPGPAPVSGFSETLEDDDLRFDVRVSPGLTGRNAVAVTVTTTEGDPFEPLEMQVRFRQAERELGPLEVTLTSGEPGEFEGSADLPVAGGWALEIRALRTDIDQAVVTADVEIG